MNDIPGVCRLAETLLAEIYRAEIRLEVLEKFESSHTVLRCSVRADQARAHPPGTVIVKQREFDQPHAPKGFDQAVLFRNEWASLDFLTSVSSESGLGPRLICSDRAAGLVVLEDLGSAESVQDVLFGSDRQAAVEALAGMGRTLGRLQRITRGHEAEFLAKQAALAASTTVCDCSLDCRGSLEELRACMTALQIETGPELDSAIFQLESVIHGPGPFRAFVHNDAGPHNLVVTARGVELLDFEFAGYGHGLIDLASVRMGFPPSFRGRRVPADAVQKMEEGYRDELASQWPGNLDDSQFMEAVAQACAHLAFSKLIGFWGGYFQERLREGEARDTREGKDPKRSAFARQQVFTYLRLALGVLEESGQHAELRQPLSQIVGRVMELWPETPLLPTYPAFGGEPWHYP